MKIISINKKISLKEGKIAVNLDEDISKEIIDKLKTNDCTISSSDNLRVIYIESNNITSNFIESVNKQIEDIENKLKMEKRSKINNHQNMINDFKDKTGLKIEE